MEAGAMSTPNVGVCLSEMMRKAFLLDVLVGEFRRECWRMALIQWYEILEN